MNIHNLIRAVLVIIAISLSGCGGGSSGTDGGVSLRISGDISNVSGKPLSGIDIQVLESGDSVTSDNTGSFGLTTNISNDTVTLLVRSGLEERVLEKVKGVKNGDIISYAITINEADFSVAIQSISINPIVPEPTPTSPGQVITPTPSKDIIKGKILTEDQRGISGLTLKVKKTPLLTHSGTGGKFRLEGMLPRQNLTLVVSNNKKRVEVALPNLPSNAVIVELELIFKSKDLPTTPSEPGVQALSTNDFTVSIQNFIIK